MSKSNYEIVKAWRKKNKDKVNAQARRYRAKHPETARKASKKWRENNLERAREMEAAAARKRRKSDPEGQKLRMARFKERQRAKQIAMAGRPKPDICEVCNEFHIRIVFDHCHNQGHFRGWLCDRCNRVLGLIYDNEAILRKLATYLETNRGETDLQGTQEAAVLRLCRTE